MVDSVELNLGLRLDDRVLCMHGMVFGVFVEYSLLVMFLLC